MQAIEARERHVIGETTTHGAGETRVLRARCSCGWRAEAARVLELENKVFLHRLQIEPRRP